MKAAPLVDAGDPPRLERLWTLAVAPSPGRLGNTLRVVVLVLLVVAISEAFQIPEAALSAYIVLFISRQDAASTLLGAVIAGVAVILAILLTIVAFMLSLSEPALRVAFIASLTFGAMFLSRTSGELGPAFFAAGFIMAYGLTLGDATLGLALMPGSVANAPQFALPELAFIPPEEALLHFLLWLCVVVAMPIVLVVAANLLTGREPGEIVRADLRTRLAAAVAFCRGEAGAEKRLAALACSSIAPLMKLDHLAGLLHRAGHQPAPLPALQHFLLVLLAVPRAASPEEWHAQAMPVADFCYSLEAGRHAEPPAPVFSGKAAPLGPELAAAMRALAAPGAPAAAEGHAAPKAGLLAADAFTNPAYTRFALKVTLAVLVCYVLQNGLDWPGIHTCVITCFFVSLTSVGETIHKATLRLAGCLVGGALGIGAILLAMPAMTDLGELLLLLAPVTFLAAWIGFGSDRIGYAGWQIGLAFYLSTLQGFGPTLDMETARDRLVGILLGNAVIFLIFTLVWPVSVADIVRAGLAHALECLSAPQPGGDDARLAGFAEAMATARGATVNEEFEVTLRLHTDRQRLIDDSVLAQVQGLSVPLAVMADIRRDPAWLLAAESEKEAAEADQAALQQWFGRAAAWVRTGHGAQDVLQGPPDPGIIRSDGPRAMLAAWQAVLVADVRAILARISDPALLTDAAMEEPILARR